jgi:hypothetical protein
LKLNRGKFYDINNTWITGHIHRSIVDKIDPTSEYVEMVKKYTLSITLGYIVLWNVIRIYLTVRNTFDEPWRGLSPPPHLGTFNVHVLGSDIFIEIYTRTLNDIFHTIVKNK